ncbi:MAG: TIGR02646 family protein [Muribaculaceae bacterium]|nr:TIGR02646 family protein [Muribaculaceae bacterium]
MKHIVKQAEPSAFSDWKSSYPNAEYEDLRDEAGFPGADAARLALRSSLIAEQHGLCCYCETRIDNGDFHVEHFRPKDRNRNPSFRPLQLVYDNLHACCRRVPNGINDDYCGHKKSNVFDAQLVSPLECDCSDHFQYDVNGHIAGVDQRGNLTVAILNLDSSQLVASRKRIIEYFEDLDDDADYAAEIEHHLNLTASIHGEFYSAIRYLHEAGKLH